MGSKTVDSKTSFSYVGKQTDNVCSSAFSWMLKNGKLGYAQSISER